MKMNTRTHLGRYLVIALCLSGLATSLLHAQQKIAVIDMNKVFYGYWKTKEADAQIKRDAADYEKKGQGMMEEYNKERAVHQEMVAAANDMALSSEERERRKLVAEAKARELLQMEQEINLARQTFGEDLAKRQDNARTRILEEIKQVITSHATKGSFTLVIDRDAETANRTPVVLFCSGKDDLSDAVLKELNASAPVTLLPEAE